MCIRALCVHVMDFFPAQLSLVICCNIDFRTSDPAYYSVSLFVLTSVPKYET